MAYRDDLEALNAQVRTLKAELEAAQQARTAAQAAAQAARAAADEAALVARRAGAPSVEDGGRRWMIIAISVGVLAVGVAGYLSFKLVTEGRDTELYHARMVQQEAVSRRLKWKVQDLERKVKRSEEARAHAEANLSITQRRCQRERARYGQGGSHVGPTTVSAGSERPETLCRSQIQAGMRGIKGKVQGCYDRYKVPGLANVQVKIGRNGRVNSARVKGMFSGTPTGACVQSAARSARFQIQGRAHHHHLSLHPALTLSRKSAALLAALVTLVALVVLVWSRLGGEPDDEQLLLQQIDAAAQAAERRDLKQLKSWLSATYRDEAGRGPREIRQLLTFYFLRRGRLAVYLISKEVQLDPGPAPREASAVVRAVLTRGKRLERLQDVLPEAARSLRFSLRFSKEADDVWRLTSAQWREGEDLRRLLGS